MPTYDTIKDYQTTDGAISISPVWVIGVIRFKYPATFDRKAGGAFGNLADAVKERTPLVLVSDVMNLSISNNRPYRSALSATLLPGQMDYLSNIMPGDWVFAWIRNDGEGGLRELTKKLKENQPANDFMDGLKFVGRVTALRLRKVVSGTGQKIRSFSLSAAGFSEFDGVFVRDPNMVATESMPQQLQEFGVALDEMTAGQSDLNQEGAVDGNKAIPALSQAFFGKGAFSSRNIRASVGNIKVTPNKAYLIPESVGKWLGVSQAKTYADILDILIGRQAYTKTAGYSIFVPDIKDSNDRIHHTFYELFSSTLPQAPSDGTIWQLLSSYLNSPLNEMYVTLRVSPQGKIMPTLVARQTPYNTPDQGSIQAMRNSPVVQNDFNIPEAPESWQPANFKSGPAKNPKQSSPQPGVNVASTVGLPRWRIDDEMAFSVDVGRNDQNRYNFVYVTPGANIAVPIKPHEFLALCPPVYDDLDIARSGVRRFSPNLNTTFMEGTKGTVEWRDILVDTAMGQHLRLNGQIGTAGIQAPIAIGDAVEYEGVAYIIESVTHACSISPQGTKSFITTLTLSMGLSTDANANGNLDGEVSIYPNMRPVVYTDVTAESAYESKE